MPTPEPPPTQPPSPWPEVGSRPLGPLTLGVDEAGRGAALGPLVMACCALDPAAEEALYALGVADSKAFGSSAQARAKRAALGAAIRRHAAWVEVRVIPPDAVDQAVARNGLNRLERAVAAELAAAAPPCRRIVLDGARLFGPLARCLERAEARNRADRDVLAVAAASILAKVARDEAFAEIAERYGPAFGPVAGGGYPNRATAAFLERYWAVHRCLPPETRMSWSWPPVARRAEACGRRLGPLSLPFDT